MSSAISTNEKMSNRNAGGGYHSKNTSSASGYGQKSVGVPRLNFHDKHLKQSDNKTPFIKVNQLQTP